MEYYNNNIQTLDPIEGMYDVNAELSGENAFREFPAESANATMCIYKDKPGSFRIFGDKMVKITRIGTSSIYNFNVFWSMASVSKRIVLEKSALFSVKYSIPDAQLRHDLGSMYQAGCKVHHARTFIKTFPSCEMYEESNGLESQEASEGKWTGTGFALMDNYIVTNYHVIEDAKSIFIQGVNGDFNTKCSASVIASDKFNDLAILKVDDSNIQTEKIPYAIKLSTCDVGEDVFVLGFPLTSTMGEEIKLTTGIISSKTGYQGDVSLYQISAPIQPGNSGGPLFDKDGNIIGVVSAKHTGAENVGYAIKTSYLKTLIESIISEDILPQKNTIATQQLSKKVESVKNYVYYITCSN